MIQTTVQSLGFFLVPYYYMWIQSLLKDSVVHSFLKITPSGSLLMHM